MQTRRVFAILALISLVGSLSPGAVVARTGEAKSAIAGLSGDPRGQQLGEPIAADAFETDDTPETATELVPDGVAQARTHHIPGDADWVYLDLTEGDRLNIFTTGDCDTFMFVFGPDTRLLRRDDDSGQDLNASIRLGVRETGRHYARIIPFDNQDACAAYDLVGQLLPPIPPDAYEDDNSAAQAGDGPIGGGSQERSFHVPGDEDWVALRLSGNGRINVFTTGRCDTVLHLFGPDGATLLVDDDDSGVGLNADIEFAVADAGTYFLRARLIDPDDTCEEYGLSGTLLPPVRPDSYESDDAPTQAKPLALDGNPQERTLHTNGDNDWVTFTLAAGDRVFLMTTGPCDTLLFLYGADGTTLLRRDDDGGEDLNAAILYTALSGGTHFARIAPISRARGICDGYRLYGSRFPIEAPTATPAASPTANPSTSPTAPPAVATPATSTPSTSTAPPTAPTPAVSPTPQRPPGF